MQTRIPFYEHLYGRGDGAITSQKFTGMGAFVKKSLIDNEF